MEQLNGTLSGVATIGGSLEISGGGASPPFHGDYEYTPSLETQIIAINGKRATRDITINPIPSNYGLITWNGSTLTVS